VAAGAHSWRVPDPCAGARPIVTVRDVLDDAGAWRQVVSAAVELGLASGEPHAASLLRGWLDAPRESLPEALAPPPLRDRLARRLTRSRSAPPAGA
jgi:alpha-L-rhamnosidase